MKRLGALAAALATLGLSCVGSVFAPVSVSPPSAPLEPSAAPRGPLLVGAAKVDITPAPGLSLLGHGPEGRVSQGTLLRLHCQAFVLSEEMGDAAHTHEEAVAFVPCDLSWPSLLLQRTAAKLLRARGVPIGPERLVLSATHTHASPAHYLGAADYSGPLSTEKPGFSQDVVDFLAAKVADAVQAAYEAKRPGCVAWSKASFHDAPGDGRPDRGPWREGFRFGKNRSVDAFAKDVLEPDEAALFTDATRPALAALDGTMSVLRIDRGDAAQCARGESTPIGAFTVVGVHPTVIPNLNDLYHGDLFGYATRELETLAHEEAGLAPGSFVAGIANGPEGDVSPLVDYQGTREARRLGGELAREAMTLWRSAGAHLSSSFPLRTAYREVVLTGARAETKNDFYRHLRNVYSFPGGFRSSASACRSDRDSTEWLAFPHGCDPMLCDVAALGTAAAGGAKDGRTFFLSLPEMREGAIAPLSTSCQAPKLELDTPLSEEFGFPTRAPMHVVLVGGELVTTFPGEVATLPAYRARRQLELYLADVARGGNDGAERASAAGVVQVGLTGEYLQYMTTSEEYAVQDYEGASSLYGPNEARFVANQQLCIARFLFEPGLTEESDHACALDYRAGLGMPRAFQPPLFEVGEVEFQPTGARSGKVTAKCTDTRPGSFAPAIAPDYNARLKKSAIVGHDGPIYKVERDGEDGYGVRYLPPPGCRDLEQQPRARVVDADSGAEISSDEGDGFELRWRSGEWRIAWYPSPREWAALKHVSPRGIAFQVRARDASAWDATAPVDEACWLTK